MALSMATRKAITKEMAQRYAPARKGERSRMLDELCALTGYNRSYAARLLRTCARAAARRRPQPRRRTRTYGPETREPLRRCWAVAGGICGKRLAPFLPEKNPSTESHIVPSGPLAPGQRWSLAGRGDGARPRAGPRAATVR